MLQSYPGIKYVAITCDSLPYILSKFKMYMERVSSLTSTAPITCFLIHD